MSRYQTLIVRDTHRGLLYEDGVLRDVLPAGRHQIAAPPSRFGEIFGAAAPRIEVVLVDVRSRDRTVLVQDVLTADCATISASFVVSYRVADPRAAVHLVRSFEDRLYVEAQTAARRTLRGLSLGEVIRGRDEIGEELEIRLRESASAYGVEVSSLDFKDLILPEELRQALGRSAVAHRLRELRSAEDLDEDGTPRRPEAQVPEPEEREVVLARMAFDRDPEAREPGPIAGGFEGLRRFRP